MERGMRKKRYLLVPEIFVRESKLDSISASRCPGRGQVWASHADVPWLATVIADVGRHWDVAFALRSIIVKHSSEECPAPWVMQVLAVSRRSCARRGEIRRVPP